MLLASIPDSQVVAGAAAVLSWQGTDSDGEPADRGTVTVGVVSSAGTTVIAAGTATGGSGSDPRTVSVTAAQTATVDHLIATWTVGGVQVGRTVHEIVGAPLITRAELVAIRPELGRKSTAAILEVRRQADHWMLDKLRRSMVPRLAVERLRTSGNGRKTLALTYPHLRAVRWARLIESDGTRTTIDNTGLIPASDSGIALLPSGCWPSGDIEIAYEHGWDRPHADAKRVVARLMESMFGDQVSTIDDRAQIYTDGSGATIRLAMEGQGGMYSPVPAVNEFVRAHRWHPTGVA